MLKICLPCRQMRLGTNRHDILLKFTDCNIIQVGFRVCKILVDNWFALVSP